MKGREGASAAINSVGNVVSLRRILPLLVGILSFARERIFSSINHPSLGKIVAPTIAWTILLLIASIILPWQTQKPLRGGLVLGKASFFINWEEATVAGALCLAYACGIAATGMAGVLWPNVSRPRLGLF
jgi:hypothetical protein